jgi:RNA polymerase sigma-70 factor (ECF subfamily)
MSAEHENVSGTRYEREAELAGLYEVYYDKIAHYAFVRVGDREAAQDLAGDVFLKALESLDSYRERGIHMQSWLFTIAHNLVVDHLRKATRHRIVPLEGDFIANSEDPAAAAERKLEMGRVAAAMDQLTSAQREVVMLRFFGGLSSAEVGGVLKKREGAVREMQRSALEKLRHLLAPEGGNIHGL